MPKPQSLVDRIAEHKERFMEDLGDRVAELQRPVPDNVHVRPAERQRRWWQVDKDWPTDPEAARAHELALQGFAPDGTPLLDAQGTPVEGISAQDVGLLKHPYREIDAKVFGGYDDDMGQYRYAQQMAELGPPDPEPLETEAQAIEERQRAEAQAKAPPPMPSMTEVFNQMPLDGAAESAPTYARRGAVLTAAPGVAPPLNQPAPGAAMGGY